MQQYFTITPETTPESITKRYRELAKTIHPDTGGNADDFSELKRQYDEALASLGNKPINGYITETETFGKLLGVVDDLLLRFDRPVLSEILLKKGAELIDNSGLPKGLKVFAKLTLEERLSNPAQFALEVEKFIRKTKNKK